MLYTRSNWQEVFQVMKSKDLQPGLPYPVQGSHVNERWNKELPRQKETERVYLHHASPARDAKGTVLRRKRNEEREWERNTGTKGENGNKCLSIITLNVNGLNTPIKRHRVAELIRKYDLYVLSSRDPPENKRPTQTESEGLEKYYKQMDRGKKVGVAIFISDKIDFKRRAIKRVPEGHFIILKGESTKKT